MTSKVAAKVGPMTVDAEAQEKSEVLELPGRMHPVLSALAIVPLAIVVLAVAGMALTPPPIPLIIILLVLIGCCLGLSWQAASHIMGGKLKMTPEGLKVSRLFREEIFPWASIEKCKVMPATGTFGDNPLSDAGQRVGVGLFLRDLPRKRDHDLDADVVLCAGDKENVQSMMRVAQRVQNAKERIEVASRRRPARAVPGAGAGAARPIRRRSPAAGKPQAAAKPADLVARFRNNGD